MEVRRRAATTTVRTASSQMRGYPKRVAMVKQTQDAADAARLWEISEELTGVRYDLPDERK